MIDELAHAGPEHLDPAFVAGYDRKQGYPDPAEDLAAFAAHGLGATSAVVDLGAGAGQFALGAGKRVAGVPARSLTGCCTGPCRISENTRPARRLTIEPTMQRTPTVAVGMRLTCLQQIPGGR